MRLTQRILSLLVALFLTLAHSVNAWGAFSSSCTHGRLQKNILEAYCQIRRGGPSKWSTIDLNKCLGSYHSRLGCAPDFNGQYSRSCAECHLDPRYLWWYVCKCAPEWKTSQIDINECVANYGGNLACAAMKKAE